ncbi:MAG TPA: CdaR family protein [Bellilinea sp.]|nr:CdaR family protein [Bellilinea sp.]
MVNFLQRLWKLVPTLIIALVLSLVVWVSSVTSQDPVVEKSYMLPIPIEVIGQETGMTITSTLPSSVSAQIRAPQSVWSQGLNVQGAVKAIIDLSGLQPGNYTVPVQLQLMPQPSRLISQSPAEISLTIDRLMTKEFPVTVVQRGTLVQGYQAGGMQLSKSLVNVSAVESVMNRIDEVRAVVDLSGATGEIKRRVELVAVDANDAAINGITMLPEQVTVTVPVYEQYGYRNVAVNVPVNGQVANGYRLTGLKVDPPSVRVYSTIPSLVSEIPGFIETDPIDLTGATDDIKTSVKLKLPENIMVVGDATTVQVTVVVDAIESSVTLTNVPVEVTGLKQGLQALVSPSTVTVIISGPVSMLDMLKTSDVQVQVNLTEMGVGSYQVKPVLNLLVDNLKPGAIVPESVEVTIVNAGTITPTVTAPLPSPTP